MISAVDPVSDQGEIGVDMGICQIQQVHEQADTGGAYEPPGGIARLPPVRGAVAQVEVDDQTGQQVSAAK